MAVDQGNQKDKGFHSKQLLEKRQYDDGTIEEDYVNWFTHGFHIYKDIYDYCNLATVYLPLTNQSYIVMSTYTGFHPKSGGLQNAIYSCYEVKLSNGKVLSGKNFL